jgi:predicted MFS family arabinose efflux permease
MAIITLAEILFVVPTQVWVTHRSPTSRKGAFQGYFSAVRYTGRSVAAWLGTTALGLFSRHPAYAWYVIVAISLLDLVLFYVHHREYND